MMLPANTLDVARELKRLWGKIGKIEKILETICSRKKMIFAC